MRYYIFKISTVQNVCLLRLLNHNVHRVCWPRCFEWCANDLAGILVKFNSCFYLYLKFWSEFCFDSIVHCEVVCFLLVQNGNSFKLFGKGICFVRKVNARGSDGITSILYGIEL
jgi:hypothetical protein